MKLKAEARAQGGCTFSEKKMFHASLIIGNKLRVFFK
jgi:hypothetical protein